MDLSTFIHQRRLEWRRLEEILHTVEGSGLRSLGEDRAIEFGRLYRRVASDLNQAQTFVTGDTTVQYLNDLVARCYLVIYGKTKIDVWALVRYLFKGYPVIFRRYSGQLLLAAGFLLAGTGFGAAALFYDADRARAHLLPADFPMIQPQKEGETNDSQAMSTGELAGMSSFYFANNTSVSLFAFAMGVTFGVGTAWMLFENGIILGALAVIFAQAGQFKAFCAEVLPHGVLELPAVVIAGAAGFLLAQGMIRAQPRPRLEELARHGKQAVFLVFGCFPLLALAGILEAVVARAPYGYLGTGFKLSVAGVFGVLFLAYLLLGGRRATHVGA